MIAMTINNSTSEKPKRRELWLGAVDGRSLETIVMQIVV
jgi:hypothetical protein